MPYCFAINSVDILISTLFLLIDKADIYVGGLSPPWEVACAGKTKKSKVPFSAFSNRPAGNYSIGEQLRPVAQGRLWPTF